MKKKPGKKIFRRVGSALHDYGMIHENDRILVGVSGGKDSQALLEVLHAFRSKAPVKYDLIPVYIDPGFPDSFSGELRRHVEIRYGTSPIIETTDFGVIAHSSENRENPCFLCSRLRRKRLFEIAQENGCRTIALGHNKDDIIETLFINMFYSGKIATMKPRQSFFNGALDIIRPLSYVEENEIVTYGRKLKLPVFVNTCPSAGVTKRSEIRQMLEQMYRNNKHIKGNLFRAMKNVVPEYMLESKNDRHSESA